MDPRGVAPLIVGLAFGASLVSAGAALAKGTVVAVMPVYAEQTEYSESLRRQIIAQTNSLPGYTAKAAHPICDSAELGALHVRATLYIMSTASKNFGVLEMRLYKVGKKDPLRTTNTPLEGRKLRAGTLATLMDRRGWVALTTPSVTC
jgi:hypothetical protein